MAYDPPNANGQATMANSSPVVIASDQSAIPVYASGSTSPPTGLTVPSGPTAIVRASLTAVSSTVLAAPATGAYYLFGVECDLQTGATSYVALVINGVGLVLPSPLGSSSGIQSLFGMRTTAIVTGTTGANQADVSLLYAPGP